MRLTAYSCRLLVPLALLIGAVEPASGNGAWRGFRGLEQQGVGVADRSPTSWSATQNIRWKTAIQGSGHSSPIVVGPHVFVTTAFESETSTRTLQTARSVRLAFSLIAFILWMVAPPALTRVQELLAGSLVALFVVLALADDRLFQFTRSPARAWIGAGLGTGVGLSIAAFGLERRGMARRALAIASGAFAVMLVSRAPAGVWESRVLVAALGVVTLAGAAAAVLIWRGLFTVAAGQRTRLPLVGAMAVIAGSLILLPVAGIASVAVTVAAALAGAAARITMRATPRILPMWRAAVTAAVVLGFIIPTVLMPRSGVVHAIAAVDRENGRVLWIREGLWGTRPAVHRANSLATPTAVSDGANVFAYFGTPGLMAVSSAGALLWTNVGVPFDTMYGVGASPLLVNKTLIVSSFAQAAPYLAAFEPNTGRELWRSARPDVHREFGDSRTPLVVTIKEQPTVISWGMDELAGHDLSSGRELWRYPHGANHRMGSMVTSMLANGRLLYLPLENGMIALDIDKLAAGGSDAVAWTSRGGASALTTPVLYQDRIYAVSAAGVATCTDALTGAILWRTRLGSEFHSSPVAMAGKIYFTATSGKTTVVAAAPEYQLLAENDIGEPVVATMAPVDGELYIRGHKYLYRIGS